MMAKRRETGRPGPLPAVEGRVRFDADLGRATWFRTGGRAEILFEPADSADLAHFLAARPDGMPVTTVGVGSNLLVRDGGVEGAVVRLRRGFRATALRWDGDRALIAVGAGALDVAVARFCRDRGVAGLEFLSGIPGAIGGALRMNAGAYGHETADILVEARALDESGALRVLSVEAMGFSYRAVSVPENWVFVSAVLAGRRDDPAAVARRMEALEAAREASQPIRMRTGGSTFANPPGASAWELIDRAGCRGLVRGGARVSEKHGNFLIAEKGASAADVEELGEEVRRRVHEKTGVTLRWEIRRIGRHPAPGPVRVGAVEDGP